MFVFADPGRVIGRPGLVAAFWLDGLVLFAEKQGQPGKDMRVGNITRQEVELMLAEIDRLGFLDLRSRFYTVPDGALTRIGVRWNGKGVLVGWDEVEHPAYGDNINPTQEYRTFKPIWKRTRAIIDSRVPTVSERGPESVRGYRNDEIDQPAAWLDTRLWYSSSEDQ